MNKLLQTQAMDRGPDEGFICTQCHGPFSSREESLRLMDLPELIRHLRTEHRIIIKPEDMSIGVPFNFHGVKCKFIDRRAVLDSSRGESGAMAMPGGASDQATRGGPVQNTFGYLANSGLQDATSFPPAANKVQSSSSSDSMSVQHLTETGTKSARAGMKRQIGASSLVEFEDPMRSKNTGSTSEKVSAFQGGNALHSATDRHVNIVTSGKDSNGRGATQYNTSNRPFGSISAATYQRYLTGKSQRQMKAEADQLRRLSLPMTATPLDISQDGLMALARSEDGASRTGNEHGSQDAHATYAKDGMNGASPKTNMQSPQRTSSTTPSSPPAKKKAKRVHKLDTVDKFPYSDKDLPACKKCAKQKMKCDKKMPKCGRCVKSKVDCEPQSPKESKRGRKTKKNFAQIASTELGDTQSSSNSSPFMGAETKELQTESVQSQLPQDGFTAKGNVASGYPQVGASKNTTASSIGNFDLNQSQEQGSGFLYNFGDGEGYFHETDDGDGYWCASPEEEEYSELTSFM